jgi:hypothetical protein
MMAPGRGEGLITGLIRLCKWESWAGHAFSYSSGAGREGPILEEWTQHMRVERWIGCQTAACGCLPLAVSFSTPVRTCMSVSQRI